MAQSNEGVYVFPDAMAKSACIDPGLLALMNQNGGFGNNGNWIWILFLWMIWGNNGWGNGFGGNNGTGFLANQLNNDAGRDLLLQAINGRADALGHGIPLLLGILLGRITSSQCFIIKDSHNFKILIVLHFGFKLHSL